MKTDFLSLLVAAVAAVMTFAPTIAQRTRTGVVRVGALAVLAVCLALISDARIGYALAAAAAGVHAYGAWRYSRVAAFGLGLAAVAAAVAAGALFVAGGQASPSAFGFGAGAATSIAVGSVAATGSAAWWIIALFGSMLSICLRAGVMPLHVGVAELCEHAPREQVRQLASLAPLVLLHLKSVALLPVAHDVAPALFLVGAVASLIPALASLAQRDLRGFYRMTTMMHGGYVLCALAAAGRGHHASALFAALTLMLAVGGLGMVVAAVEERCGRIDFTQPGGRVVPFPHLAGAFAILGAAGVGLPATAGFVADDLLLHAAWEQSVVATGALIIASVALAISTLRGYSKVFLGSAGSSIAPDMILRERVVVVAIIVALLILGLAPQLFIRGLAT